MVTHQRARHDLPHFSIENRQRHMDEDESCPSPTIHKYGELRLSPRHARPRLPQFQQSKRWPKMHNRGRPAPDPIPPVSPSPAEPPAESEERALTMREASFEQQRATKKPLLQVTGSQRSARPRITSDSSIDLQNGGLCRSASPHCWQTVKATVTMVPQTTTKKWHRSRSRGRKVTPTKHREVKFLRASDRVAVPGTVRVAQPVKSQQPPVTSKQLPVLPAEAQTPQEYFDSRALGGVDQERPPSPVPSLHDPEKDSRFSRECRELLRSMSFNQDWLLPAASVLPAVGSKSQPLPSLLSTDRNGHYSRQNMSFQDALTKLSPPDRIRDQRTVPDITITTTGSPRASRRRPQAPARASSKTVSNLVNILQMTRAKPSTNESVWKAQSVSSSRQAQQDGSPAGRSDVDRSFLRMPSTGSTSGQTLRSPRSAMSVDTLAKIEAQVQSGASVQVHSDLQKRPSLSSESRHSGPPSIPPERPLPALPAGTVRSASPRHSNESSRSGKRTQAAATSMILSPSTIRVMGQSRPSEAVLTPAMGEALGSSGKRRAAEDNTQGPNRHSIDISSLISRRSTDSGNSLKSSRNLRHSISSARADKVKEKRMRDLATSRNRSPQSDRPTSSESVRHSSDSGHHQTTTPPTSFDRPTPGEAPEGIDQLDQFPAVPVSRPGSSLANVRSAAHSRGQSYDSLASPVRRLSRKDATGKPVQVLGQSNIFVVVDSDPLTARFRAGAMSPAPSIGANAGSRPCSPLKTRDKRAPSSLREVATQPASSSRSHKYNTSIQGEKCEASAAPVPSPRKAKRNARHHSLQQSSSSDESTPGSRSGHRKSPHKTSRRPTKRRRWNSGDISLIKTLHENLEDYYGTIMKQEDRIRWQANQIRMMIRVIAPMNRARGIKGPHLDDVVETSPGEDDEYISQQYARSLTSGLRPRRQQRQPSSGSPMGRVSKERVTKPGQGHRRHNSGGNNSTASGSAAMSPRSTNKPSADDASMTDPRDYDLAALPLSGSRKVATLPHDKENQPPTVSMVSGIHSGVTLPATALRHPPPVSTEIPRGRLLEEMSFLSSSSVGARLGYQPSFLHVDEEDEPEESEEERRRNSARLSVNHVLTSTEQMDKALEEFAYI
ncbi:hypothetical protein LTR47_007159 [Exophiala xenobiotica]|nr:hypothetical protein LTR47_007159 [Exophiala xenobiotica]KAK5245977.1 hypothetical protein LTS06_008650 [Exophiala xenobiotica]KAK5348214.1 hypothetical protein LTR61_008072 [Exophiala xenobiotica]KAK5362712.1 hypothetical protein LTR11_009402 [Exophiala xenobiotica]KAK5366019.1 hypothetical protein LTS03_008778 [Exophiala xenobiotica]